MLDRRLVDLIEEIGFITSEDVHVYGAAAVSCAIYTTVESLNQSAVEYGRKVAKYLLHSCA